MARNSQRRTAIAILLSIGAVLVVVIGVGVVAHFAGLVDEPQQRSVPAYTVVSDQDRTITVEVDTATADGLRAVFDQVRAGGDRPDGGYFVLINCSAGAARRADYRLANGRFAIGKLGAAQTGLPEGGSDFELVEGRTCPPAS